MSDKRPINMPDEVLERYETQELFDELQRRYPHVAVLMLKETTGDDPHGFSMLFTSSCDLDWLTVLWLINRGGYELAARMVDRVDEKTEWHIEDEKNENEDDD